MPIDLTGSLFNIIQEQIDEGQALNLDFTLKNSGDEEAQPFSLDIFISTDNTITEDDFKLGKYDILESLKANEEVSKSYRYSTPAADNPFWDGAGDYYVGFLIDPDDQISELNETNNGNQGSGIDLDIVNVVDFGQSDIVASSLTVGGGTLSPGAKAPVGFTIRNQSTTESAHPFSVDIYLTANDTFNPSIDFKLGTYDIREVLAAGEDISKSFTYTLPSVENAIWSGNGTHHIHLDIDPNNEVLESDDDNNSGQGLGIDSFSFDVTGIDEAPDLVVTHFDAPDSFTAGDTITVDYGIANYGGSDAESLAAGFYITTEDYLSSGESIGLDDVPDILFMQGDRESSLFDVESNLIDGQPDALLGTTIRSTELTIPEEWGGFSGNGEYVIGAIADVYDDVAEKDESNNSNNNNLPDQSYKTVSITAPDNTGKVDLVGSYFEVGSDIEAGGEVDLSFKVANQDIGHVDSFDIDLYLSHDENISADEDYYLGTYTIPEGIAGKAETDLKSYVYQAPEVGDAFWQGGDAPYYAGMIIDPENLIDETDETNNSNQKEGLDFGSTPQVADLTIKSFELVGSSLVNKGETIEVKYEIMNDGTGVANNFAAGFFLFDDEYQANNDQLSLNDVPEVFFIRASDRASNLISLEAGESTGMVTTEITLPTEWVGFNGGAIDFNLGVAADPFDDVEESNELNNSFNSENINFADVSIV